MPKHLTTEQPKKITESNKSIKNDPFDNADSERIDDIKKEIKDHCQTIDSLCKELRNKRYNLVIKSNSNDATYVIVKNNDRLTKIASYDYYDYTVFKVMKQVAILYEHIASHPDMKILLAIPCRSNMRLK
uniref:Uncharacterized protein n=1 Tax=viral metagenome TaxID=1070528 RepID=A0A6C0C9L7_9ZZZZ